MINHAEAKDSHEPSCVHIAVRIAGPEQESQKYNLK